MYGSLNPELLGLARANVARFAKQAFVAGGDPTMQGGGDPSQAGGAPPGGDPSQGGGMPPGGDPSQGGGAPPGGAPGASMDPTAGQGGVTPDIGNMIQQQVSSALQAQMGGAGGAGGMGGGGGMKPPKIDENVVMLQILKILAKIADALKIPIPASEMVVTQDDLKAMAQGGPGQAVQQDQQQSGGQAGTSAIQPIQPMQAAAPGMGDKAGSDNFSRGEPLDTRAMESNMNKAAAILAIRRNGR